MMRYKPTCVLFTVKKNALTSADSLTQLPCDPLNQQNLKLANL